MPAPSDLVHETTTTTGTGTLTLVAVNGKRTFNTAFGTGGTNLFDYYVSNRSAAEWERGTGHLSSAAVLVRDTVLASSNSGSAVNFSAGTKDVINDIPAGKQIYDGKSLTHTIYVPASAMIAATTSGPEVSQFETTTNKQNYKGGAFDASADEYYHFNIAFPASWNLGTLTFKVYWTSSATDTDGVAWGLQAVACGDGDPIDASWGTPIAVTDDNQSAAGDVLVTSISAALTVGGTPAAEDLTFFRLFRDVSDANDDMTEDATPIGVKVYYTINAASDV